MTYFKKRKTASLGFGQFRMMVNGTCEVSGSSATVTDPAECDDPDTFTPTGGGSGGGAGTGRTGGAGSGTRPGGTPTPGASAGPAAPAAPATPVQSDVVKGDGANLVFGSTAYDPETADVISKAKRITTVGVEQAVAEDLGETEDAEIPGTFRAGDFEDQRAEALESSHVTVSEESAVLWDVNTTDVRQTAAGPAAGPNYGKISNPDVAAVVEFDPATGEFKIKNGASADALTEPMVMGYLQQNSMEMFGKTWAELPESQQAMIVLTMQGRTTEDGTIHRTHLQQLNDVHKWTSSQSGPPESTRDPYAAFESRSRSTGETGKEHKREVRQYMQENLRGQTDDDSWNLAYNSGDTDWKTLYAYTQSEQGLSTEPQSSDEEVRANLSKKPEDAVIENQSDVQQRYDQVREHKSGQIVDATDALTEDLESGKEVSEKRKELKAANPDKTEAEIDEMLAAEFSDNPEALGNEGLYEAHQTKQEIEAHKQDFEAAKERREQYNDVVSAYRKMERLESSADFRDAFRRGEADPAYEAAKAEYQAAVSAFEGNMVAAGHDDLSFYGKGEDGAWSFDDDARAKAKENLDGMVEAEELGLRTLEGRYKGLEKASDYEGRMQDIGKLGQDLVDYETEVSLATEVGDEARLDRLLNPDDENGDPLYPEMDVARTPKGDEVWEKNSGYAKVMKSYEKGKKVFDEGKTLFNDGLQVFKDIQGLIRGDDKDGAKKMGLDLPSLSEMRTRMKDLRQKFSDTNSRLKAKEKKTDGKWFAEFKPVQNRKARVEARGDKGILGSMGTDKRAAEDQAVAQGRSAEAAADSAGEKALGDEMRNIRGRSRWV